MEKFMEIVGGILAFLGLVCIVKHLMHHEGCLLCSWQQAKEESEQKTGSRYGSNPVR